MLQGSKGNNTATLILVPHTNVYRLPARRPVLVVFISARGHYTLTENSKYSNFFHSFFFIFCFYIWANLMLNINTVNLTFMLFNYEKADMATFYYYNVKKKEHYY